MVGAVGQVPIICTCAPQLTRVDLVQDINELRVKRGDQVVPQKRFQSGKIASGDASGANHVLQYSTRTQNRSISASSPD